MRERRLQSVETIIEWQERVPPKAGDDGLLLDRQDGGLGVWDRSAGW
jgi:hypothetical protein